MARYITALVILEVQFYNELYCYDPSTNSWSSPLAYGMIGRDGVACGVIGDRLYIVGGRGVGNSSNPYGINNNESYYFRSSENPGVLTEIGILFNDSTPNGNVRLGIYADNNGAPGNLLLDAGAATVANGWVSKTGLSLNLPNGTYWLAFVLSATNSVSSQSGGSKSLYWRSYTYGALPASFGSGGY